jgi:hypothetical protein
MAHILEKVIIFKGLLGRSRTAHPIRRLHSGNSQRESGTGMRKWKLTLAPAIRRHAAPRDARHFSGGAR